MKPTHIPNLHIQRAADRLDQALLALKFYGRMQGDKYWLEFCWAIERLERVTQEYTKEPNDQS